MDSSARSLSDGADGGQRSLGTVMRLQRAEFDGIDLKKPPRGAWYLTKKEGRIEVGAGQPVWMWLGLLLTALVVTLLSVLFVGKVTAHWLDAIGVRPLAANPAPFNRPPTMRGGFELPLWLSTPFSVLAAFPIVVVWWYTIRSWFVPVRVVIDGAGLWVRAGYGPLSSRRCVAISDVTDVGAHVERIPSTRDGFRVVLPAPDDRSPAWLVLHGRIERRGVCLIEFGGLLDEPRRRFVISAVKHAVSNAKRADRAPPPV